MKMVGVLVVILILVLIRVFLSYFREKRLNKRRDQLRGKNSYLFWAGPGLGAPAAGPQG